MSRLPLLPVLCVLAICIANAAVADTIHLRSGGRLEGLVLNADEKPRQTYQIRLQDGGRITLDVADVRRVVQPSPEKKQYQELLARMPSDTAEMHWKMVEVCSKLNLARERKFHLERVIELDTNHEQARRALRYKQQKDGSWARLEDIRAAEGKVRHNGKWMTPAEAEIADAKEARKQATIAWKKKLRMWRGWLKDRRRQQKALEEIQAITDPLAAEPLVEMFWSEKSLALRQLLAEVLGRINSGTATGALAKAAMQGDTDDENEIRLYAVKLLEQNNRRNVVPAFVSELRSGSNTNVRRAAYVLGKLGDESVVLPLIKALRTKHTKLVGGAGNGNINVNRNGGLSVGRTKPKKVDVYLKNREVLSALVSLTDKDFEYDQHRWLAWYLSLTTPPNLDLRRDS